MKIKSIILFALIIITLKSSFAVSDEAVCRESVVSSCRTFGFIIKPNSFSSKTFADFNITPEEFNELELDEQIKIYQQIKPLEVVAQETIDVLNSKISRISGSPIEYLMLDALEKWRSNRDNLRAFCLE